MISTSCNYEKITGTFKSSDGESTVPYYLYIPSGNPFAVLQISHGACEYIERYEREGFVSRLTEAGIAVCGNDHLGHGPSADPDKLGHFTDYEKLVSDNRILRGIIKKRYPSLPYVLFGQGMGSFVVRDYITRYDDLCRDEAINDLTEWVKEVAEGVVACRSYNFIPFGRVE